MAAAVHAHDLPRNITARMTIQPDGQHLHVFVRVPLGAMNGITLPQRGPGFLDLEKAQPLLEGVARSWITNTLTLFEDGQPITGTPQLRSARFALESDAPFTAAQLAVSTEVPWAQVQLESILDYPIRSSDARFSVRWRVAREDLRASTILRFGARTFEYDGDPGIVSLNPSRIQAAGRFMISGFRHFAAHPDALLLLVATLLPLRSRRWSVVGAFIVSLIFSFSWAAAASAQEEPLWWRTLVEFAWAGMIFYLAIENIAKPSGIKWRWALAFAGGVIAGNGLSYPWREIEQFAGGHRTVSIAAYEAGSMAAALAVSGVLVILIRAATRWRLVMLLVSIFIAHAAWHTILDRGGMLGQYSIPAPDWNAAFFAKVTRTLFVLASAVAVAWVYKSVTGLGRRPSHATHAG